MAQSLIALPSETVFAECRAFVFFYDIRLNQWSEIAEPNVYSRIQLLCSRPPGSTGMYRLLGRLETTGMVRSTVNWLVSSLISLNLSLFHMTDLTNYQEYQSLSLSTYAKRALSYCFVLHNTSSNTGPLLRCIYLVARLARQWMKERGIIYAV